MPARIPTLLTCMLLGSVWTVVLAGPMEGELFGYRLGAKYSVGAETKGYFDSFMGQFVIVADRPKMSADFHVLELITTPKTFTIVNIYASAEFADEEKARAFETRYADLLSTMYSSKCSPLKAYLGEALKMLCSKRFELTVHRFKPDKPEEKQQVHVGLKFNNNSAAGKQILAQFAAIQDVSLARASKATEQLPGKTVPYSFYTTRPAFVGVEKVQYNLKLSNLASGLAPLRVAG